MSNNYMSYKLACYLTASRFRVRTGVFALRILAARPGKTFQALELSARLDYPGVNLSQTAVESLNIPVCDGQALREYRARLRILKALRAQLLEADTQADLTEIDWERNWLRAEIRRSTKPRGGIKNYIPARKYAYLRLRNSLTRLIYRAARESPSLADYIRSNLSTDNGFTWLGDAIESPAEPYHGTHSGLAG